MVTFDTLQPGPVTRRMRNTIFGLNACWTIHLANRTSKHFIFGTRLNLGKPEQHKHKFPLKRAWHSSRDLIKYGTPSNISPKRVKLHTWNLAYRCIRTISPKWTDKIQKGYDLDHVTLINFGIPQNISPKCVKLLTWNLAYRCIWTDAQTDNRDVRIADFRSVDGLRIFVDEKLQMRILILDRHWLIFVTEYFHKSKFRFSFSPIKY